MGQPPPKKDTPIIGQPPLKMKIFSPPLKFKIFKFQLPLTLRCTLCAFYLTLAEAGAKLLPRNNIYQLWFSIVV